MRETVPRERLVPSESPAIRCEALRFCSTVNNAPSTEGASAFQSGEPIDSGKTLHGVGQAG
jgi:hypothetical protein